MEASSVDPDLTVPPEAVKSVSILTPLAMEDALKTGVGYIRQNDLQFHHLIRCTQDVNIYRNLFLICLASTWIIADRSYQLSDHAAYHA